MYLRAFSPEPSDGLETDRRLLVETPRGLVSTSIAWATVDPGCPGRCPAS